MTQPEISMQIVGGSFAILSAALWAIAAILWMKLGKDVSALGMNLGKALVALVCLTIGFCFVGFPTASTSAWLILGLSGIIGISIGDTTYFAALMRLGPRKLLVLTTLTPLFASLLAILFLQERPNRQWAAGAVLCVGGVAWVIRERLAKGEDRGSWRAGVWLGLLTVACDTAGTILSKVGMEGMDSQGPMDATFIRLSFGAIGLIVYGLVRRDLGSWLTPLKAPKLLGVLIAASIIGTFLGIWLSLAALWYTNVTVASILNSTSPLFILPLAFIFMKERITLRAVIGAIVAVVGVALVMTS